MFKWICLLLTFSLLFEACIACFSSPYSESDENKEDSGDFDNSEESDLGSGGGGIVENGFTYIQDYYDDDQYR